MKTPQEFIDTYNGKYFKLMAKFSLDHGLANL